MLSRSSSSDTNDERGTIDETGKASNESELDIIKVDSEGEEVGKLEKKLGACLYSSFLVILLIYIPSSCSEEDLAFTYIFLF